MKKNESGAIIVEASLVLPFFMFAIIIILSISNMCYAQARIGTALDATAKEISEYAYIYSKVGLNEIEEDAHGVAASTGILEVDQVENFFLDFYSKIKECAGLDDVPTDLIDNPIEGGIGAAAETVTGALNKLPNPIAWVGNAVSSGYEGVKSSIISNFAKILMQRHLKNTDSASPDAYLAYLGVLPKGASYIDGIDLSDSAIFIYGTPEIRLIAHYDIMVWRLLGFEYKLSFTQCAATKAWFSYDNFIDYGSMPD